MYIGDFYAIILTVDHTYFVLLGSWFKNDTYYIESTYIHNKFYKHKINR